MSKSLDKMIEDAGVNNLSELLKLALEQHRKDKEEFSRKPKKEQLEIKIDQVRKSYNACLMVGNWEGLAECKGEIEKLLAEYERLE